MLSLFSIFLGAIIVYDVTNATSFDNLEDWINVVRKYTRDQEKVSFTILLAAGRVQY